MTQIAERSAIVAEPFETPTWLSRGRIPGLDALRAISIVLVLAAHSLRAARFQNAWFNPTIMGFLGVDVFFVISGFLITLLLCREQQRTGQINLKGFYYRRSLRILPAYLVFLLGMFILTRVGWQHIGLGDWIAALTYTMNWRSVPAWSVGHIWSLSTEEQFYLLWPPIMMWVSRKAARRILFTTVFAGPLFRIAARVLVTKISPSHPYLPLYTTGFFARPEPIAAGCLMALLAVDQDSLGNLNRWFTWRPAIFAAMIAVACIALASHVKVFAIVCRPTISALTIPIMLWACANARGWAARALAWRPAVALGVLSYSIYLWQQPFLSQEDPDSRFTRFPIGIGLALAAAIVSYLVVERPFLKLKDRAAVARRNAVPDAL